MAGKGSACASPGSVGAEHGAIKSATRALSEKPRARRNPDRGNQKSVNRGIEKRAENELIYRAHFGFLRAWTLNEYWRGTKYETILGSQCETILGSRFEGMELGFRTMWGARRGLRDIQAGMPACGVSRWRETPFPPPWPLQFSKQLRLACPKTEQHSQTCARTQWQVEDGEKIKQNKGQTLRYLSVRRKRASYNELILGTVFALDIKIFRYNDYSVARCHGIQKAEHGVR